jgi:cation diffusion facilitator family transporter
MSESKTAVVAALLGNAALAILKGVSAMASGSAAMLAETFHSLADTGNQLLLFLGIRLGQRPPDRVHPFGHGKNVYFWAFVVSLILFSLGGASSIWEAVRKVLHGGEAHRAVHWAYVVLAGSFVFESASLTVALRSLRRVKGDQPLFAYWRENRDPTLLTVLLEDTAALLSLVIAAIGLGLARLTGDLRWDAAASGTIGVLLIAVAVILALENYSLLIGEAASPAVEDRVRAAAASDPAVRRVAALHTMHVGPEAILITVEVRFRPDLTTAGIEEAVDRLHRRIEEAVDGLTNARLIVVEPARAEATPVVEVRMTGVGASSHPWMPRGA